MSKKVLISLEDFTKVLRCEGRTFYDGCRDPDLEHLKNFKAWFEAQPEVHAISKGTASCTLGVIMGRIGGDKYDIEANLRCYLLAAKGLGLTKQEMEAVLKRYHPEWDLSLADWAIFDEVKRDE